MSDVALTRRQAREVEYHRQHAKEGLVLLKRPLPRSICDRPERRWWNPYWHAYATLLHHVRPEGNRVLVIGCGFGEDAVRMAILGFQVDAFDLSGESLEIAKAMAERERVVVSFLKAPVEQLPYPDQVFDAVLAIDILHHVDIPKAMTEMRRVLKPGGVFVAREPYTHRALDRMIALPKRLLHSVLVPVVYGTKELYITADERKLTERDVKNVTEGFSTAARDYFQILTGRLFFHSWEFGSKIERAVLRLGGGYLLAGSLVITATR